MLVIFTTDGHEIEWHVGEKVPEMWGSGINGLDEEAVDTGLQRISYLQADSQELEHIQKRFQMEPRQAHNYGRDTTAYSIPMPNRPVCRWYGDLARTIYLNL